MTRSRRCVVSFATSRSSAARPPVEGGGSAVPGGDTASESPAVRQTAAARIARKVFFIASARGSLYVTEPGPIGWSDRPTPAGGGREIRERGRCGGRSPARREKERSDS